MELNLESEYMAISPSILESEVYMRLQGLLSAGDPIPDAMWDEVMGMVLAVSPHFVTSLRIMTGNRLTEKELHSALLVRCGFRPREMSVLLARSNGAVISRRITLGLKILGARSSVSVIDGIIRAL